LASQADARSGYEDVHLADCSFDPQIIGGLVLATIRYTLARKIESVLRYQRYRHDLGRAILLGLEVLVAADIIRTVAFTPTMDSVIVLGIIVAIRTFLSWSLALELDGHWQCAAVS
jgi:uncharacterized membrane protein